MRNILRLIFETPGARFRRRRTLVMNYLQLCKTGEASGYELTKALGLSIGALYPTLDRMECGGILVSRWGVAPPGRRWRPRLYRLAPDPANYQTDGDAHGRV